MPLKTEAVALLMLIALLVAGCGPSLTIPASKDRPARVVASAYTQDGCIEAMKDQARSDGVDVKLAEVESNLGWEIFVFPFYKGYRCTGEVVTASDTQ